MNKYSDIEIQTAKNLLEHGYIWIARNRSGRLFAYSEKPIKSGIIWNSNDIYYVCEEAVPIFQNIRFDDKEPVSLESIVHPQILDDVEKRYLSTVIRPFRNRVEYIRKIDSACEECIYIQLNGDWVIFPHFRTGTMYKGMKTGKEYSLEELGL